MLHVKHLRQVILCDCVQCITELYVNTGMLLLLWMLYYLFISFFFISFIPLFQLKFMQDTSLWKEARATSNLNKMCKTV